MHSHYYILQGKHETSRSNNSRLAVEIAKAQEERAELQRALDEQRQLRETAEAGLRNAKDDVFVISRREIAEVRARDSTIEVLRETIDTKDDKIRDLENELKQRTAEAKQAHEAATAEIARLKAVAMGSELRVNQLRQELSIKSSDEARSTGEQFDPVAEAMTHQVRKPDNCITVGTAEETERKKKKLKV
ncbi:hypothetical protein B0T14DRAFT_129535 [Immersiella caudata]|uniref:Uncharacterized protein n=1 Tax=Immersiella caudata TaxID=314043 RepID=A0AA39X4K8_9PEZI|nr:hypothetical protein B0T14DRAFT_129535 [Immersiella caudata]